MMTTLSPPLCHVDTCRRDGCSHESGCQGHAWREAAPDYYRKLLAETVAEAARDGLVLTVEQVPLQPLAMGHHTTVVSVRPARKKA